MYHTLSSILTRHWFSCGVNIVKLHMRAILSKPVFKRHLNTVKPVFNGHLHTVKPVFEGHLNTVKPVFEGHLNTVKHLFKGHLNTVKPVFKGHLNTVKPVFKGHLNIWVSLHDRCPFITGFLAWGNCSEKMSPDHRVSPHRSVPWRQVLLYLCEIVNVYTCLLYS